MEYTVVITKEPNAPWRAIVPALPECEAEAETRDEVLAQIKERLVEIVPHSEVVRLEFPLAPMLSHDSGGATTPSVWEGFGLFRDDPSWGQLFDEIERQRDEHQTGA